MFYGSRLKHPFQVGIDVFTGTSQLNGDDFLSMIKCVDDTVIYTFIRKSVTIIAAQVTL